LKKVIEIHEVNLDIIKKIINLDLKNCILTFDDGLASQWHFIDDLIALDVPKIFFISTDIICDRVDNQSKEFIKCSEAHKKAFEGNKENYMTWSQIKTLSKMPNCYIGGHSHKHKLYSVSPLKDLYINLSNDSENMLEEFKKKNIEIDKFCFPYNEDYDGIYRILLSKLGIENFYGKERISIEDIE